MTVRALLVVTAILATVGTARGGNLAEEFCQCARDRIEQWGSRPTVIVDGERIFATAELPLFYEQNGFLSVWSDERGPTAQVEAFLEVLETAAADGLRSADYHLRPIRKIAAHCRDRLLRGEHLDPNQLVDFDLLLTDAFFMYADHAVGGRVDPETIDSNWFIGDSEVDLVGLLRATLRDGDFKSVFSSLQPHDDGYRALREELQRHRKIAGQGGWTEVPRGPVLKTGDGGPRVRALRQRLVESGDLPAETGGSRSFFDVQLEEAVLGFQRRHGIAEDGVVGRNTLRELNRTVGERIAQIEVNLERWRWLPQGLGSRYVLVNLAAFLLEVVEGGETVLDMKVITGRPYRKTPVFADTITYLVINPQWNVATTIAKEDMLPKIRKEPGYLREMNLTVLQGWGKNERIVDPAAVDWSGVTQKNLPYRFRQAAGPENALGRIKFMFPNKFDVYLHDTPARQLFDPERRAFSSGCIRVELPLELAENLLSDSEAWNLERIEQVIEGGETQTVRLGEPVPVYLLYWTAWVDDSGVLQFREDIYERDEAVERALLRPPPRI